MAKIRVLIADDHAVLRAGLRKLLDAQTDIEVVAEAGDGEDAVRRGRETHPDIVLLDISMPGPRTAQIIARLRRQRPATRIVILTMHDDHAYLRAALAAGAAGYVVKKAADAELLSAIRAVHRGRTFIDSTGAGELTAGSQSRTPGRPKLSRREAQVLRLLAEGHTNQEAATRLKVSVKTVETYRARLGEKLQLRSRAELYRFAVGSGLLAPDAEPGPDP